MDNFKISRFAEIYPELNSALRGNCGKHLNIECPPKQMVNTLGKLILYYTLYGSFKGHRLSIRRRFHKVHKK